MPRPVPTLIDILRETLQQVEQSAEFGLDDPALIELKHAIVRTIAELEIARLGKSKAA